MLVLTGGAGFIGSAFLSRLNSEGVRDVVVVDELGFSDKWKNLGGKVFVDYLPKERFLSLIERGNAGFKPRAVVHLGACTSTSERNASYMIENNYVYSKLVARWALDAGARFVYASSAAIYGDGSRGFLDDDGALPSYVPLNVYGLSKHAFDSWAIECGASKQMAGLRFFNVYGPNEYHKGDMSSVVLKATAQLRDTGAIRLFRSYRPDYADGEQKRDFIYVKDCTDVLWWLLQHTSVNGVFNLGTGNARSWNDLGRAVAAALGRPAEIQYVEMPEVLREQYQYFTEATMEKLRAAGYARPFTSLEDGVREYVGKYLVNGFAVL